MGKGGGCAGVKPGVSPYETHSWCSVCEEYKIRKPLRCPDCNHRTRSKTPYTNDKVYRY